MSPVRTCRLLLICVGLAVSCTDDAEYEGSPAPASGSPAPASGAEAPANGDTTCPTREARALPPIEASWHTNLQLAGAGFLSLRALGPAPRAAYCARKVQMHLDEDGCLATGDDLRLQGYSPDGRGKTTSPVGDVCIPPTFLPATATSAARFGVNVNANSTVPGNAFEVSNPAATSNFPSSVTVYDSLGNGHQITTYFAKTGTHDWEWHAVVEGSEITGGTPGIPFEGANGTLTFSSDGALQTETTNASTWDFIGATAGQQISFDFGTAVDERGTGLDGTTNFAAPSTTNAATQDGYAAGYLTDVRITAGGAFACEFTNGHRTVVGQIPIATFPFVDGLAHACDDLWVTTSASGAEVLGSPGTLGRGGFVPTTDSPSASRPD
ncbi:MAG: hypothetical protein RLZZ450_3376, partial [Pseudomonadota bacterium]